MGKRGRCCLHNLLVSRIRTDLDVVGPGDLSKFSEVNRAKKRLVGERGENPATNVTGKIDDPVHSVWIGQMQAISCERLNLCWSFHQEKNDPSAAQCKARVVRRRGK